MVIATEDEKDGTDLYHIAKLVRPLQHGVDYEVKSSGRNISFTDSGLSRLENKLGVAEWGEELIAEAERKVSLIHIDWCWSDHLAHAAEIRANIHMVSLGGLNAFDTFNKEMNQEFRSFLACIDDKVAETMSTATITAKGIDLEKEGLNGPSSTWTFMINDNPRGDLLSQIIRGVASRLKNTWK